MSNFAAPPSQAFCNACPAAAVSHNIPAAATDERKVSSASELTPLAAPAQFRAPQTPSVTIGRAAPHPATPTPVPQPSAAAGSRLLPAAQAATSLVRQGRPLDAVQLVKKSKPGLLEPGAAVLFELLALEFTLMLARGDATVRALIH